MSQPLEFTDELLSAYLDGELSANEQALVERALAENAEARQLLDDLKAIRVGLQALPRHELPGDLAERVLRRAERESLAPPSAAAAPCSQTPPGPPAIDLAQRIPLARARRQDSAAEATSPWRNVALFFAGVAALLLVSVLCWPRQDGDSHIAKAPENKEENLKASSSTASSPLRRAEVAQQVLRNDPNSAQIDAAGSAQNEAAGPFDDSVKGKMDDAKPALSVADAPAISSGNEKEKQLKLSAGESPRAAAGSGTAGSKESPDTSVSKIAKNDAADDAQGGLSSPANASRLQAKKLATFDNDDLVISLDLDDSGKPFGDSPLGLSGATPSFASNAPTFPSSAKGAKDSPGPLSEQQPIEAVDVNEPVEIVYVSAAASFDAEPLQHALREAGIEYRTDWSERRSTWLLGSLAANSLGQSFDLEAKKENGQREEGEKIEGLQRGSNADQDIAALRDEKGKQNAADGKAIHEKNKIQKPSNIEYVYVEASPERMQAMLRILAGNTPNVLYRKSGDVQSGEDQGLAQPAEPSKQPKELGGPVGEPKPIVARTAESPKKQFPLNPGATPAAEAAAARSTLSGAAKDSSLAGEVDSTKVGAQPRDVAYRLPSTSGDIAALVKSRKSIGLDKVALERKAMEMKRASSKPSESSPGETLSAANPAAATPPGAGATRKPSPSPAPEAPSPAPAISPEKARLSDRFDNSLNDEFRPEPRSVERARVLLVIERNPAPAPADSNLKSPAKP